MNGQEQLVSHIFKGHSEFAAREKEGVGGGTPSPDQMTEVIEVPKIRQAARRDYSLQNAGSLQQTHKTRVGKLAVNPFLPTRGCAGPKFKTKGYKK